MNKEIFEQEIERIIDKYSNLESIVEVIGENTLNEIALETYYNIDETNANESNIENSFIQAINNKICKQEISNTSLLQKYFNDVGYIYDKQTNDEIEFCEENRDKIIESNLKCVVKIAKAYRNLGIDFEDLISAGNEGLCIAFDKYKPNRDKFKNKLLAQLSTMKYVESDWIYENLECHCKYGKLKKQFDKFFIKDIYSSKEVIDWINKNIKTASFNSVAMFWVQAWIRAEISKNSRLIKKPISEIKKEKKDDSKKNIIYSIDASSPNSKCNNTLNDTLELEESANNMEINDAHKLFHDNLKLMFDGLEMRNRRIIMQRFGIGLVRPMKPIEIANREKISKARVSQIIRYSLDVMKDNSVKYNIDSNMLYELIDKCKEIF